MVFLIQKSQNKESMAIQLKLNELIAANHRASNLLVGGENLTEEELQLLQKHYQSMVALAQRSATPGRGQSTRETTKTL